MRMILSKKKGVCKGASNHSHAHIPHPIWHAVMHQNKQLGANWADPSVLQRSNLLGTEDWRQKFKTLELGKAGAHCIFHPCAGEFPQSTQKVNMLKMLIHAHLHFCRYFFVEKF